MDTLNKTRNRYVKRTFKKFYQLKNQLGGSLSAFPKNREKVQDLIAKLEEVEELFNQYNSIIIQEKRINSDLKQQVEILQPRVRQLEGEVESLLKRIEELNSELGRLGSSEERYQRIKQELAKTKQNLAETEQELDHDKRRIEALERDCEGEKKRLQASLDAQRQIQNNPWFQFPFLA